MELRAFDKEGNPVKASIHDFAQKLRRPTEEVKIGSSPTNFVYRDQTTNAMREVDLQEVAQAAGMRNVQFNFDPKMAREQGYLKDRDIDQGVAYNLERIKTEEGRKQYLADKGYMNVAKSGGDYYSFQDGAMYPVNNKDGIDLSDLTRMGATLGRDAGAGLAATAAVGGGAVAALPSGGTSLVAGVAAAGAAGAVGGVVGEIAHRGFDKLVGADADKYNRNISMSEEGRAVAESAAIGAVGGAAQPLLAAGGAKVAEKVVVPALKKAGDVFGSEFLQTQAAKVEAGALMTRMPQGFMSKTGSSEEAVAMDAMNTSMKGALTEGRNKAAKGEITGDELSAVTGEARDTLMRGSEKVSRNGAEEVQQRQLRQNWQSTELQKAEANAAQRKVEQEIAARRESAVKGKLVKMQEQTERTFPSFKKELEALYNEGGDAQAALAGKNKIVNKVVTDNANAFGLVVERDSVTGQPLGFDQKSFTDFINKQIDDTFYESGNYLKSLHQNDAILDKVPDDTIRGEVIANIRSSMYSVDEKTVGIEAKTAVRELLDAVSNYGVQKDTGIKRKISDFHEIASSVADDSAVPRSTREAFYSITNSLEMFESSASTAPQIVRDFYGAQHKLLELKDLVSKNKGAYSDDVFNNLAAGIDDLTKMTGDIDSKFTDPMMRVLHLDHILSRPAGTPSPYLERISLQQREGFEAFQFIKDYDVRGAVIPTASKEDRQKKKSTAAILGGMYSLAQGDDFWKGALGGYVTGSVLPGKVEVVKEVGKKAIGKTKNAVKKATMGSLKFADRKMTSKAGDTAKTVGKAYGTMVYSEEALRKKKK